MVLIFSANHERLFSVNASKIRVGPRVINKKRREGGYLDTFKNESTVNVSDDWLLQSRGSP